MDMYLASSRSLGATVPPGGVRPVSASGHAAGLLVLAVLMSPALALLPPPRPGGSPAGASEKPKGKGAVRLRLPPSAVPPPKALPLAAGALAPCAAKC